ILDGRFGFAAVYLLVAAGCTFVGIIHSPLRDGLIDLPWNVLARVPAEFADAVRFQTPYHWCGAYAAAAALLLVLGWFARGEKPDPQAPQPPACHSRSTSALPPVSASSGASFRAFSSSASAPA